MAQFWVVKIAKKYRHQLVEARHQGRVGVDVDDIDLDLPAPGQQGEQGVMHVLAQVAIAARIQGEVHPRPLLPRPQEHVVGRFLAPYQQHHALFRVQLGRLRIEGFGVAYVDIVDP
jgi:hypothetical protein